VKTFAALLTPLAGLLAALLTLSSPRVEADAIDVVVGKPGVFIHLDASGRKSLALSGDIVALAWEDNRDGMPRCRLGLKRVGDTAFRQHEVGRGECFEPALAALDRGRFLLIWEDEAGVAVALAGADGPGPVARLAASGGQGSVAWHPELGAFAAWSASDGRWRRLWRARLNIDGLRVEPAPAEAVDPAPPADDQLFPVLAATAGGLALAWEDRRLGHTVIHASHSPDGRAWTPPRRLSGNPTGKAEGGLGRGTGAMRPALAGFGDGLAATWLDKRDFLSGYDVYAALSEDGGARFGKDGKAQDSFGDAIAQWHAAVAGNRRGDLVIAFDDERDGTADIWLTRLTPAGWSENHTPPAASGPGRQTDPAVALDESGHLHLAWIDRSDDGATRLRYTVMPPPAR
jgi:hypothetical protein